MADQCAPLADVATKQRQTYLRYLEALLAAELEERERNTIARRIKDARLPRMKTLEEFDFSKAPQVAATKVHELAQGGYIERAEPILLIGDCGTGKTHLLRGLCVAACRQKRRAWFATAAALVNELDEAKQQLQLRRVRARWERYDLIAIDEVRYVPMADIGAEFLFQVIAERAEKAAVIAGGMVASHHSRNTNPTGLEPLARTEFIQETLASVLQTTFPSSRTITGASIT